MIEMALVILISGIILSGFLQILNANIQTRMNQLNLEASETMKTSAVVLAIKGRTISSQCVAGTCSVVFTLLGTCVAAAPCPSYTASYPVPAAAAIAVQNDAWGAAMTYTAGAHASVSSATPGTDTVFTIASKGPDTAAGTTDDITYTVTVNEFIARISRSGL